MTAPAHAPIPGAFTISGAPRCTCGYHYRTRWGSEAREELRRHLAHLFDGSIHDFMPAEPTYAEGGVLPAGIQVVRNDTGQCINVIRPTT